MRDNPERIVEEAGGDSDQKINAIADALTAHFKTIMERSQMDKLMQHRRAQGGNRGSLVPYLPYTQRPHRLTSPDGKKKIEGGIEPELQH